MKQKVFLTALLIAVLILLTACSGNPLVGTWRDEKTGDYFQFASDRKIHIDSSSGDNMSGIYSISGNKLTMEISEPFGANPTTITVQFSISGDTLSVSGPYGDGTLKRQ